MFSVRGIRPLNSLGIFWCSGCFLEFSGSGVVNRLQVELQAGGVVAGWKSCKPEKKWFAEDFPHLNTLSEKFLCSGTEHFCFLLWGLG